MRYAWLVIFICSTALSQNAFNWKLERILDNEIGSVSFRCLEHSWIYGDYSFQKDFNCLNYYAVRICEKCYRRESVVDKCRKPIPLPLRPDRRYTILSERFK